MYSKHKDSAEWERISLPTSQKLTILEPINGSIYIAGENGTLLKYTDPLNTPIITDPISTQKGEMISNTSNGLLSLTLNHTRTITHSGLAIYKANGRVVFSSYPQVNNGLVQVDVSHFSAGVYFVKLTVNNESYISNIVIY